MEGLHLQRLRLEQAHERQPVSRHQGAQLVGRALGGSHADARADARGGGAEVCLGDDALLGGVRLEEGGLQQRARVVRHGGARPLFEHRAGRHLVQLGGGSRHVDADAQLRNGAHHREHEGVGGDAAPRAGLAAGVERHLVAQVGLGRRARRGSWPLTTRSSWASACSPLT